MPDSRHEKPLLSHPAERRCTQDVVLVVHGGAGTITRQASTPEQEVVYHAALREALLAGYNILQAGGEAMDAAVEAVTIMEGEAVHSLQSNPIPEHLPRLTALQRRQRVRVHHGRHGASCLARAKACLSTHITRQNELEASIMLSKPPHSHDTLPPSRRGLGLSLLTRIRNPSHLARALYLTPPVAPHAFLSGPTAESLWESLGGDLVDPSYFFTEHRWREHRRGLGLPEDDPPPQDPPTLDPWPKGTVGAVALDVRGCIAVVTSTGGRTNKLPGRIGDTPMMGAGFWAEEWSVGRFRRFWDWLTRKKHADKRAVGISGTGDGDVSLFVSRHGPLRLTQNISSSSDCVLLLRPRAVSKISTSLLTEQQSMRLRNYVAMVAWGE